MPVLKVQKDSIIAKTLEILSSEPLESINARKIAKALNCSVQPIYFNFANMDELKKCALEKIYELYQSFMEQGSKEESAYKGMGLAYINFARVYPNYFKLLFMQQTDLTATDFIINDDYGNNVIKEGMKLTGFDYEKQKEFHLKVWIFTHGLATLVATNTVKISESEIKKLLEETVREILKGYKEK